MGTHKVAILGYGGFGQFLHHSWDQLDNVEIIAVADEVIERKPASKSIRFYQDWKNLCHDDDVEIVSIVTPPSSHAEIACKLIEAGKHVIIEKPIATSIKDAKKILKARDKNGVVATVNFMLRFNPIIEALKAITLAGSVGKLRHVNIENYAQDDQLPKSHWFWDPQIAGGILIEHAVHFIDITHSLTDAKLRHVNGLCHFRNPQQEDQVQTSAAYSDGLITTHYHSFARPGFFEDTSMRFNYDLAEIDVYGWIPLTGKIKAIVNSETKAQLDAIPGFSITKTVKVERAADDSRPDGWGNCDTDKVNCKTVNSGGIDYEVSEMIEATFDIGKDKQLVYADCVRAMMEDIIGKIDNPEHKLTVTAEDGLRALEVACPATECGRKHK